MWYHVAKLLVLCSTLLFCPPVSGFSLPTTASMAAGDFSPRAQGVDFLDQTGGLWSLPTALVPLPHERLRLANAVQAAQLARASTSEDSGTLSAHEAHATFLPLRQALQEMQARAAREDRRCLIGISGAPGADAADFARLLAAVCSVEEDPKECGWARGISCTVVNTEGYLHRSHATEPFASPDDYDCARLASDIARLREKHKAVDVPGSEPVKAGLVLVHGPFLLRQEGAWAALDGLFDLTLQLQMSDEDTAGSQDFQDSLGRLYVPTEVVIYTPIVYSK